jgi:hypothetical protein
MSFSGVGDVFIPRTLNEKKTPGAPDWEQLFGEGVFAILGSKLWLKREEARSAGQTGQINRKNCKDPQK